MRAAPFTEAIKRVLEFLKDCKIDVDYFNIGGGLVAAVETHEKHHKGNGENDHHKRAGEASIDICGFIHGRIILRISDLCLLA